MADLPEGRLKPSPPFMYSGFFGPWLVKEGRETVERYGVLFNCLVSRAVHLETATSLDKSSFLNTYPRFIGRRGPVRHSQIHSQKWIRPQKESFQRRDVVIVSDEVLSRNQWKLGRVVEVYASEDNLVTKVKLAMAYSKVDNKGRRRRLVSYIVSSF